MIAWIAKNYFQTPSIENMHFLFELGYTTCKRSSGRQVLALFTIKKFIFFYKTETKKIEAFGGQSILRYNIVAYE